MHFMPESARKRGWNGERNMKRNGLLLLAALLLALLLVLASLCLGSSAYRPWQWWASGPDAALARTVVLQLRLPRTLAALGVGGLLAVAGALQQVLLRNPLADPYILGTSGGASVGALAAILLGASTASMDAAAAAGALGVTLLVFLLAGRVASHSRLLLTGVAIAAFCGALITLMLSLAPDGQLRGMVFWMMGDLADAHWPLALGSLALLTLLLLPLAQTLNVLSLGTLSAHGLGVNLRRLQWTLYLLVAGATAVAVTTAGMIGFVGLIVPHGLRLLLGPDHKLLLPAAAIGGGSVLLAADLVARTLIAPQQLPVGVVTALAGVPVFLYLLLRRNPGA